MTVFPTWYTSKAIPDWTDVVWSSDAIINFNLTVASIALYTMTNNSTTDLLEGTNLYYTEARVTANTTVVAKADKTNVLELDNAAVYTPTADYHPATKKYVDDNPVPSATETSEWIVERATDAEAAAGTDTTRYISSKQLADNLPVQPAQTTTYLSSAWEDNTTSTSFVTLKTFTATKSGAYRVEYTWRETANSWSGWTTRIEVDWIIYWEFWLAANNTDTFLWVVHIVAGDAINFQAKQTSSWSNMRINATTVKWT